MDQFSASYIRLTYLFRQLVSKTATPEQKEELMALMADPANEAQVHELLLNAWEESDPDQLHFSASESKALLERIASSPAFERQNDPRLHPRRRWRYFAAAASVLLGLSIAGYLVTRPAVRQEKISDAGVADIAPGTDKAVLTLPDGRRIALDDAPAGILVDSEKMKILKSGDGALVYDVSASGITENAGEPGALHTVTTPRGGKYRVVLPDGSVVWLNAASSLRYPARFSSAGRTVELTGEAYFEISTVTVKTGNHPKIPFKVISGNQVVEVLGTHFNINSYADEAAAKTTLLEGSIRVSRVDRKGGVQLRPGQQCLPGESGDFRLIENADIEDVVAWKDNLFSLKSSDIYSIMRQLARWYDVEVEYSSQIPPGHLTGYISRDMPLSRVLQMLEQISDLRFNVEGRTITVTGSQSRKNGTAIHP